MKATSNLISLILVTLTTLVSCTSTKSQVVKNIQQQEFQKLMAEPNVFIIDVRTPSEISDGYIKGTTFFINLNSSDFESKLDSLDKSKIYLVYCRSGNRSTTASNKMAEKGFKNIYNLQGGISNWTGEIVR